MKKKNSNNKIQLILIFLIFISCSDNKEKIYYENILQKEIFHNGLIDSVITYYPSGNIHEVFTLENGMMNGKFLRYFNSKNKNIKAEMNFNEGVMHGAYTNFFENGSVRKHTEYNKGIVIRSVLFKKFPTDTSLVILLKDSVIEYFENKPMQKSNSQK